MPALQDEVPDDDKLPDDGLDVEDESTAPAVKSGYRPPKKVDQKKEDPKKELKPYAALIVLPGEEDLREFQEIINHKEFITKTQASTQTKGHQEVLLSVKTTTFQQFKNGKKEDAYDFVGLAYLKQFAKNDLEEQKDFIHYYTQVPIVHVFLG